MKRLVSFGDYTIIGAGGDMSDWQEIQRLIESQIISEYVNDDGHCLGPEHIHEYLARVMYARRSKNDPLWNSLVVGGFKNGTRFTLFYIVSWVMWIYKELLINHQLLLLVMELILLNHYYVKLLKEKKIF